LWLFAFVDKVIKDLEAMYNNKPKDSLPQTQKTGKTSLSLDKRYLEEYHQPSLSRKSIENGLIAPSSSVSLADKMRQLKVFPMP
jgi:hypothetical protein